MPGYQKRGGRGGSIRREREYDLKRVEKTKDLETKKKKSRKALSLRRQAGPLGERKRCKGEEKLNACRTGDCSIERKGGGKKSLQISQERTGQARFPLGPRVSKRGGRGVL